MKIHADPQPDYFDILFILQETAMETIIRNIVVIITFALLTPYAFAGSIVKPYTFTNGSTADANQVNADFDTVYSQTNKNTANISSLSTNQTKAIVQVNTRLV